MKVKIHCTLRPEANRVTEMQFLPNVDEAIRIDGFEYKVAERVWDLDDATVTLYLYY